VTVTVSIWWLPLVFYIGLFGGVFITLCCQCFKKSKRF
jgi:hypothetical protein